MERINRPAILGPIVGIILNLSMNTGKYSISSILLSTAGFNMQAFEYLLGVNWLRKGKKVEVEQHSRFIVSYP